MLQVVILSHGEEVLNKAMLDAVRGYNPVVIYTKEKGKPRLPSWIDSQPGSCIRGVKRHTAMFLKPGADLLMIDGNKTELRDCSGKPAGLKEVIGVLQNCCPMNG